MVSHDKRQNGHAEALQRALRALQANHPDEAERIAADILNANADHAEATSILGYAMLMQGKVQDALVPLEKTARTSRNPEAETQFAIVLHQVGESEKAVDWLRRAITRRPPYPLAFHTLGSVLQSLHRPDEAIAVLKQGVAAAPNMIELWVQLGFVCYAANDRAQARSAFDRALAINSRHPKAGQGMISVLMDDGDYVQAAKLIRTDLAANPGNVSARIALGRCLLELGETDAAYTSLRQAYAAGGASVRGKVLEALVSTSHGRFWLHPSMAEKFLKDPTA